MHKDNKEIIISVSSLWKQILFYKNKSKILGLNVNTEAMKEHFPDLRVRDYFTIVFKT